jgi:hypothetical protein
MITNNCECQWPSIPFNLSPLYFSKPIDEQKNEVRPRTRWKKPKMEKEVDNPNPNDNARLQMWNRDEKQELLDDGGTSPWLEWVGW